MKFIETEDTKVLSSKKYNYVFNKISGDFMRWGETEEEDPDMSVYGPEIADIEITEICHGVRCDLNDESSRKVCPMCYKGNNPSNTSNMSFEVFKQLFDKLCSRVIDGEIKPWKVLTQIAFGADAQATANPDLWRMMYYCRNNPYTEVIPNITVADISDETADKLVEYVGAVSVSYYPTQNKNCCYESVKKLTDRGLKQTNIHVCIYEESFEDTLTLFKDIQSDERLSKMGAVVMLSLKKKGRGVNFTPLSAEKFKVLVDIALKAKIDFGFDSCSAPKFLDAVRDSDMYPEYFKMSESCESFGLFSSYFNWEGKYFPCSFAEGEGGWDKGIDVINCNDFLDDVWFSPLVNKWRKISLGTIRDGVRHCPLFNI